MKVAFDIKNNTKLNKFAKNDCIVYDGKEWYVTTATDLFADLEKKCNNAIQSYNAEFTALMNNNNIHDKKVDKEIETLKADYFEFKKTVSAQLLEMAQFVKYLIENNKEK